MDENMQIRTRTIKIPQNLYKIGQEHDWLNITEFEIPFFNNNKFGCEQPAGSIKGFTRKEFMNRYNANLPKCNEELKRPLHNEGTFNRSSEYQTFRMEILDRDNNTCRICGIKTIKKYMMQIHHRCAILVAPHLCLDPKNVITVCSNCHHNGKSVRISTSKEHTISYLKLALGLSEDTTIGDTMITAWDKLFGYKITDTLQILSKIKENFKWLRTREDKIRLIRLLDIIKLKPIEIAGIIGYSNPTIKKYLSIIRQRGINYKW